jgi:chloramphenicol 3-O phosphotransferase
MDAPEGTSARPAHAPVIVLNGASGAGKTSIAHALQGLLASPSIHLSEDIFMDMAMGARVGLGGTAAEHAVGVRVLYGLYRSAGIFAALGLTVTLDIVLEERDWLRECLKSLEARDVLFVGVHCPLDELERRELARPDRSHVGLARSHVDRVHQHELYDLELDTSRCTPHDAAQQIQDALARGGPFTAFARLRARGY